MNANGSLVESLKRSEVYREYEAAYAETIGLPLALRPVETWLLPLHGQRRENGFCALMARQSRSCAACLELQEKLTHAAMDSARIMTCGYGLTELAVPVKLGAQTIGFLQTGQVLRQEPTLQSFEQVLHRARELGVTLDQPQARETFFARLSFSTSKLESLGQLLSVFAGHLSITANQVALQQANAEPPLIRRAKEYIREHHTEDLSLGRVASAVHSSIYHFCKCFRRSSGITFTEFVSRTRVEKAKNLLLNPNLRVSEIAFEVGFQSLTHFNRTFRRIAGESPSDYRGHLPRAA